MPRPKELTKAPELPTSFPIFSLSVVYSTSQKAPVSHPAVPILGLTGNPPGKVPRGIKGLLKVIHEQTRKRGALNTGGGSGLQTPAEAADLTEKINGQKGKK